MAALNSRTSTATVHISTWDRNEVKVDAVKYADTKERLDEAQSRLTPSKDTSFDSHQISRPRQHCNWGSHNNPAERGIHTDRAARGSAG